MLPGLIGCAKNCFFTTRARERDDNLLFVRERLLKSEADRAALLDLYKKLRDDKRVKDDETNPLISVLRLSGITRVVEGLLYVRNRIYYRVFDREWVLANLPDAEVQRQCAAYRRGEIWSLALSPDGKTLLSTSKDNTIRFWRAATDADVQARRGQ
jgi:WD40 repeat protein